MHELTDAIVTYFKRVANYDPLVVGIQLFMIGLVVFATVRFLRGTRGARLVKGTALTLAIVFIAIRLLPQDQEWKRIEFLYGNFLVFTLAAFLVAFQPELRRALISIGQARLFRRKEAEVEGVVNELVQSASYLSRTKTGAIIAIERSVGLGGLSESGTTLDALVTSELLNTIFYPGTSLHDMGVIIRHNRIAAAGCQFPLAESEEVDPSLGSRHRAALGLAKDSDAVLLVVSEETGRISLAYENQLHIGLDQSNVRDLLLQLLQPKGFGASKSASGGTS
jgi:diadenylate cyclase